MRERAKLVGAKLAVCSELAFRRRDGTDHPRVHCLREIPSCAPTDVLEKRSLKNPPTHLQVHEHAVGLVLPEFLNRAFSSPGRENVMPEHQKGIATKASEARTAASEPRSARRPARRPER